MIERIKEFPSLTIIRHPLVQHKLTILRDQQTETKTFKELVDEIAMLMAYEATSELSLEPKEVNTPLEKTSGWHISGKKLTLVPILRAGLGMVEGILRLVLCRRGRCGSGALLPASGRMDVREITPGLRCRSEGRAGNPHLPGRRALETNWGYQEGDNLVRAGSQ